MDVYIPIKVVRKNDGCEVGGMLYITFRYVEHDIQKGQAIILCDNDRVYRDDEVVSSFSLCMENRVYESSIKSLCFESALLDISKQIQEHYCMNIWYICYNVQASCFLYKEQV